MCECEYLIKRETETIPFIQSSFEHLCQLFEKHILRYFHYSCCYLLNVSLSLSRQCLWNHSNTQVCRLSDFHLRTFLGVAHLPKLALANDLSLSATVFDWTHLTSVWVPLSLHRPSCTSNHSAASIPMTPKTGQQAPRQMLGYRRKSIQPQVCLVFTNRKLLKWHLCDVAPETKSSFTLVEAARSASGANKVFAASPGSLMTFAHFRHQTWWQQWAGR